MDTTLNAERQEIMRLAQAFEGIGGAIHEGRIIPLAELEDAQRTARDLWTPNGPVAQERRLHAACDALLLWAPDASQGDRAALGYVQRSAYVIAKCLRLHAIVAGRPGTPRPDLEEAIQVLDAAYARYAPHGAVDNAPTGFNGK